MEKGVVKTKRGMRCRQHEGMHRAPRAHSSTSASSKPSPCCPHAHRTGAALHTRVPLAPPPCNAPQRRPLKCVAPRGSAEAWRAAATKSSSLVRHHQATG